VVEHSLGKGEAGSSILPSSTTKSHNEPCYYETLKDIFG
tara:strand:+ start:202 stop:318 length:117 start_codon:yes stop_codon:yes gene_type:complete